MTSQSNFTLALKCALMRSDKILLKPLNLSHLIDLPLDIGFDAHSV